ncbi:DUF1414 domain-containing protein [Vibrio lentus]|nr:DUF1414 domain-containing protein [Vibrio lentus]
MGAVLTKHKKSFTELSLMIAGNIATNVLNQNVASQRKGIAEKFAEALVSSLEDKQSH